MKRKTLKEDYSKDKTLNLKIGGEIVGKAIIRDYLDGDIFLTDFEIDEKFRGKGYGKKFMGMFINKYGVNCLTVNPDNLTAINLYKNFGFKEVTDPYYDENAKETVVYMKRT